MLPDFSLLTGNGGRRLYLHVINSALALDSRNENSEQSLKLRLQYALNFCSMLFQCYFLVLWLISQA